jgi:hypothetical protein
MKALYLIIGDTNFIRVVNEASTPKIFFTRVINKHVLMQLVEKWNAMSNNKQIK